MKDILGKEISEGDKVVFNPPHYKGLIKGTVLYLTPKMVKVEFMWLGKTPDVTTVFPHDVCVYEKSVDPQP